MKVKSDANKSADQKFVGIRLDPERAEQLKSMADAREMSLNQLIVAILSGDADDVTNAANVTATVGKVRKSLDMQNVNGDDLQSKLQRLHALVAIRDRLEKKRDALNEEKPADGPLTALFNAAELQEWRKKAKGLEEKYHKIVAKIDALEDEVLSQETAVAVAPVAEPDQGDDDEVQDDPRDTPAREPNPKSAKPSKKSFLERAGLA